MTNEQKINAILELARTLTKEQVEELAEYTLLEMVRYWDERNELQTST